MVGLARAVRLFPRHSLHPSKSAKVAKDQCAHVMAQCLQVGEPERACTRALHTVTTITLGTTASSISTSEQLLIAYATTSAARRVAALTSAASDL
jgi:hypothetical protein